MSIAPLIRQGLSSLLNSAIIDILAEVPTTHKAIDLLKQNFTFTAAEIADYFQSSYSYALAAISAGLVAPENQHDFWQSLFQAQIENEFAQHLAINYLSPFAQQQGFSGQNVAVFRATAITQCEEIARLTLFQAKNVPFSEAELAGFITVGEINSMTQLVLTQIQRQYQLAPSLVAFFASQELLGNAFLFFLHEQLHREPRFNNTLAALQREELLIEVRKVKQMMQATQEKFHQAVAAQQLDQVTQLSQRLAHLQQIESITQTHYAQFIEFSQYFAQWAQFIEVPFEQIFRQIATLETQIGGIKNDVEQISEILQQLMVPLGLSTQIKPGDELTQHSPNSLKLSKQAQQLLKRIPPSAPQYSQLAIELGSVVFSQGDWQQAEVLLTIAYQQTNNDEERALTAFNLFQVFVCQQIYDQALLYLQTAIEIDEARYALHNVHAYSLQQLLGAGGMGCVFLARHRLKPEFVIIKCFWETGHGSLKESFKEAFLTAKIVGEYVPQPLDYGFVDLMQQKCGYFVSEYLEDAIDGETWLAKYSQLDVSTGIAVGLQIAQGLQLAHDKGIFHLDLKPTNILLQQQFDEIIVKITDFGFAKLTPALVQQGLLQANPLGLTTLTCSVVFDTQNYAPPEQQGVTRYGKPGAKSDIYAFGKTLYRLLTGDNPQIFTPAPLAEVPALFDLLCHCVEAEPAKRVEITTLVTQLAALQADVIKKRRTWWDQLEDEWKDVFKKTMNFKGEPTDSKLEKIVNLPELDLNNSQGEGEKIASLEPLRALTKLEELDCSWNKISDLQPLSTLTNLQKLNCQDNRISDLQPLCALTNLRVLNCSLNQINDLQPLCALTKLQELDCWKNQISNLQPLHALTNLRYLDCNENQISDLQPLQRLKHLQYLDCNKNQISDLQPLGTLMNLRVLTCEKNQVNDLQPLRALKNLQTLDCRDNQISDLQPLRTLTNLWRLWCDNNQISDLEPLRALANLWELRCNNNKMSDLQPLRALTNLQYLSCNNNKISDLQPLHALMNLRVLICDKNEISDLQPLHTLTDLQILDCRHNQIDDLAALRALTNLQKLWCDNNKISELEPLYTLTNLQILVCAGNQISRAGVEQFKKAVPGCYVDS